jgi:hypothetical protein
MSRFIGVEKLHFNILKRTAMKFLFNFGAEQINIYSVRQQQLCKKRFRKFISSDAVGVRPRREIASAAAGHFTLGAVFACVCIYMRSKSLCL